MPQQTDTFTSLSAQLTARNLGTVGDTFTLPANYSSSILESEKLAFPSGGISTTQSLNEFRKVVNQIAVDLKDESENLQAQITDKGVDISEIDTNLIEIGSDLQDIATDLIRKAWDSIQINAGTGLSGGGDLTADRTVNLKVATTTEIGGTRSFAGSIAEGATESSITGHIIVDDDGYMKVLDNAIELGVKTRGNYVKAVSSTVGDGVTITNSSGEGVTPDFKLTERIVAGTIGSSSTSSNIKTVNVPKITYNKFGQITAVTTESTVSANNSTVNLLIASADTGLRFDTTGNSKSKSFTLNKGSAQSITIRHNETRSNAVDEQVVTTRIGAFLQEGTEITQADAGVRIPSTIKIDKYGHVTNIATRALSYGMTQANRLVLSAAANYSGTMIGGKEVFDLHVPREADFKALKAVVDTNRQLALADLDADDNTDLAEILGGIVFDGTKTTKFFRNAVFAGDLTIGKNFQIGDFGFPALSIDTVRDTIGIGAPNAGGTATIAQVDISLDPRPTEVGGGGHPESIVGDGSTDVVVNLHRPVDGESKGGRFGIRMSTYRGGSYNGRPLLGRSGGIYATVDESHGNQVGLAFHTGSSSATTEFGVERMKLTHDGRLGIGISAPTQKLEVIGTSRFQGAMQIDTAGDALKITGDATLDNSDASILLGNNGVDYRLKYVGSGSETENRFQILSNLNGTQTKILNTTTDGNIAFSDDRLVIKTSGNVGIGVTNPTKKLHVAGTARFTGNVDFDQDLEVQGSVGITAGALKTEEWLYHAGDTGSGDRTSFREAKLKIYGGSTSEAAKHHFKLLEFPAAMTNKYAFIEVHRAHDYGSTNNGCIHKVLINGRINSGTDTLKYYHKHEGKILIDSNNVAYIEFFKNTAGNVQVYLVAEDYYEGTVDIRYMDKSRESSQRATLFANPTSQATADSGYSSQYSTKVDGDDKPNWEEALGELTVNGLLKTTDRFTADNFWLDVNRDETRASIGGFSTSGADNRRSKTADNGNIFDLYGDNNRFAEFRALGSNVGTQSSGRFFAGQASNYGGGLQYIGNATNGAGVIKATGGSSANDLIQFFRREANSDICVFEYPVGSSNVSFRGGISVKDNATITQNLTVNGTSSLKNVTVTGDLTVSGKLVSDAQADSLTSNFIRGHISVKNPTETGTPPSGTDSFSISNRDYKRGKSSFFAGTNIDYLVFEKTDQNGAIPDGGMIFSFTGNDSIEREKVRITSASTTFLHPVLFDSNLSIRKSTSTNREITINSRSSNNDRLRIVSQGTGGAWNTNNNGFQIERKVDSSVRGFVKFPTSADLALQFGNDSGITMTINNNKNVGIGTTTPQRKLDVVGRGRFAYQGATLQLSGDDANSHTYIEFRKQASSPRAAYIGIPNNGSNNIDIAAQLSGADIELKPNRFTRTNKPVVVGGTTRLNDEKLRVVGRVRINSGQTIASTSDSRDIDNAAITITPGNDLSGQALGLDANEIIFQSDGNLGTIGDFGLNVIINGQAKHKFANNGRVGINTLTRNPTDTLEVNGTFRATGNSVVEGTLTSEGNIKTKNNLTVDKDIIMSGHDFRMYNRTRAGGNSHDGRALVHGGGDVLEINHADDFTGGVKIGNVNAKLSIGSARFLGSSGGVMDGTNTAAAALTIPSVDVLGSLFLDNTEIVASQTLKLNSISNKIFIRGNNKVGIGRENPQYPLDVNGIISARGITVGNTSAGGSSQHNLLYNANNRYTVTQSGTAASGSNPINIAVLFDGTLNPTIATGLNFSDPYVLEIAGLPNQAIQRYGMVGWTSRFFGPKKFKIELFDSTTQVNKYITVADFQNTANEEAYNRGLYAKEIGSEVGISGNFTKMKLTVYEAGAGGQLALSEVFFIHPEATRPFSGLVPASLHEGGSLDSNQVVTAAGFGATNPTNRLEISTPDYDSSGHATDETRSKNIPVRVSSESSYNNQVTGIEFKNGSDKTAPTSRIVSKRDGNASGGEKLEFQTQPKVNSGTNNNQPTTKLILGSDGENQLNGYLNINGGNAYTTAVSHTLTSNKTFNLLSSNVFVITVPSSEDTESHTISAKASSYPAGATYTFVIRNQSEATVLFNSGHFVWVGETPEISKNGTDIVSAVSDGSNLYLAAVHDDSKLVSYANVRNIKTISTNAVSTFSGTHSGRIYTPFSGNMTVKRPNSDMIFNLALHIGNNDPTQYAAVNIEYQWNGTDGTWIGVPLDAAGGASAFGGISIFGHHLQRTDQIGPVVIPTLVQDVGSSNEGDVFYWRVRLRNSDGAIFINRSENNAFRATSWITVEEHYKE